MRLQDNIDFTTLQWVRPELEQTLSDARESLESYVGNPTDAGAMRVCADCLHQVQGTLRMVELPGPAMVATEMESLAILPDWLRQRLIDLERASDAASTQVILLDLHRQLAADARCLPLFEVEPVVVSRGPIPGMPEQPVTIYQDFERWRLPQDYPDAAP